MTTLDENQLLDFVDTMPAFRGSVQRLLQLASDINANSRDIVQVIETDPLMTVKVLKVINSPFCGLAQKISSVQRAVVHLGINTIKNMALSVAAIGALPAQNLAGFDNRAFLFHSLSCAALCKHLADRLEIPAVDGSDYYVAGLLHDFGKVVFAAFVPLEYKTVLQATSTQALPLNQLEVEILGLDHSQAGKMLARHWGLAEGLIEAIDHHHGNHMNTPLSDCLFAANQLSKKLQFGFAGNPIIEDFPEPIVQRFGMNMDDLITDLGDLMPIKTQALAFID